MILFKKVIDLQHWLDRQRAEGADVGFIPTMGALHDGHLELVHTAARYGDVPVVSIFVNPTQFNDPKDLEKYPRLPGQDLMLLQRTKCAAVWMPPVEEVYPPGCDLRVTLDFGVLEQVMEGQFRPGHFQGMATVVNRLIDVVQPKRLYMGQKDFQQLSIVRNMLTQLQSPVELRGCPTVREDDGVAMSSRNMRLSPAMRQIAPIIYQTLTAAKQRLSDDEPAADIQAWAMQHLADAGLRPEYFEIVDGITLLPVPDYTAADLIVACTAAWADHVRLIDNVVIKGDL
jgi:pantoate--beta-alanine ligase